MKRREQWHFTAAEDLLHSVCTPFMWCYQSSLREFIIVFSQTESRQPSCDPTSWVLQPSLSCAIWGIYIVTHHWESRGLPLYSKHYATIIMRNWDKWQAFLPTECHNPATSNGISWLGHHAVCSAGFSCYSQTEAKGCTWGSTWKESLNTLQAKWRREGVRGEAEAPWLGQHLSTQPFPRIVC